MFLFIDFNSIDYFLPILSYTSTRIIAIISDTNNNASDNAPANEKIEIL